MKPLSDVEAPPGPEVRKKPKKPKDFVGDMVPISTSVPREVADMIQAEAEFEIIYPSQIVRRILIQHYRALLKEKE